MSDSCDDSDVITVGAKAGPSLRVFLNYRHEDAKDTAWALYWKLEERFGAANVFFDHGSLQPGMRWSDEIKSHLGHAGVVIALIGPQWTSILRTRLQRGGDDYVVKEIDFALRGGARVTFIPVLLGDTELPDSDDLPSSLKPLASRQAERLRHTDLSRDIDELIERLVEIERGRDQQRDEGQEGADPGVSQPPRKPFVKPSSLVAPAPDESHYHKVIRSASNLVVFLGSGANADEGEGPWSMECGRLPDDRELAKYLATYAGFDNAPSHLTEVAQYAVATCGEPESFQEVRKALRLDLEPGPVHRYLARLPAQTGGRYQMIVTPKYDIALEKAFREAGEDFDAVVYMAPKTEQEGRFVHIPWDAYPQPVHEPNKYFGMPIVAEDQSLSRTVIVKINGTVDDASEGFPWADNYVITEDHYIDYLSSGPVEQVVPTQILAKLRKANYLFLGYSIADWRLRVFLNRIWKGSRLGRAKYWAVESEPNPLEVELWQSAGVTLFQSNLTDYLRGLYDYLTATKKRDCDDE